MTNPAKILALIDANNPPNRLPVSVDTVTLSAPVADYGAGWNTKLKVSSISGHGFYGDVDVFYHRVTLPELGTIRLLSETQFTSETIVSMINAKKGTDLSASDLHLDLVTVPTLNLGGMETVVLAAQESSLGWTGETEVSLLFGLPGNVDLLHQIVTELFPGDGYFP